MSEVKTNVTGLETVLKNLNQEIKEIKNKSLRGMIRSAILIRRHMEFNSPTIPVDTGNLRASWFILTNLTGIEEGENPEFKGEKAPEMALQHSKTIERYRTALSVKKEPALLMGFTANYAFYVHEATHKEFKRPESGAKFLESALKANYNNILKIIREEAKV